MNLTTIQHLNQLNRDFYATIAEDFSQSRQKAWAGWNTLLPVLSQITREQTEPSILDLGCGNGRFGYFLQRHFPQVNWKYVGIDNNETFLAEAAKSLPLNGFTFIDDDIIGKVTVHQPFSLPSQEFDVIVAFGILHHIPSRELRQNFLKEGAQLLKKNGKLIIASWQFDQDKTLLSRAMNPEDFNLSKEDLEKGDYLLPWKSHTDITRYSHLVSSEEMSALLVATGLSITDTFHADGHEGTLNLYAVATK
jgi:tRNA (uracil-5-)-methyltransferase TRM9